MTLPAEKTLEREKLTAEVLRSTFIYDPDTGLFSRRDGARLAEYKSGNLARYRAMKINSKQYYSHRLAWLYVHGVWPPNFIDHINGDPSDNRISNLRSATPHENMANVKRHRDNGNGLKGAYPTAFNTWCAKIMKNGKTFRLGNFKTKEEAHAAYCLAAKELHGEFGRAA